MLLDTVLKTKFFRPKPPADFINRSRLYEKLDNGVHCPLSLVSAAAGYGKSLLVSSWLDSCARPSVWLSLDEGLNDLSSFLQYFLFAIRKLFPDACPRTLALLSAPAPHLAEIFSTELVSELSEITTPFILVLDDYGFIHDLDIHEILSLLLKYRPSVMQLVVLTRRDPPFPLHALRAQGDLVEIRQKDLQFTMVETDDFLRNSIGVVLGKQVQTDLYKRVEGWAVGLRLIALSLQGRDDVERFLREMKGDTRHTQDYLMAEVLSRQSPALCETLLKTSILNRFCAPLCEVLCYPFSTEMNRSGCDGAAFLHKLEESNIFCIALDDRREWVRYHHLFQQLLQQTLEKRYSSDEIRQLHDLACSWFEENGMIEEAFHHALNSRDPDTAGKLVARHRHALMNKEQWSRLGRLIDRLPDSIIKNNPALLIQDAWCFWNRMQVQEMIKVLDQVESLLVSLPMDTVATKEIQGEIDALRSIQYYLTLPCDADRALTCAQQAMKNIPSQNSSTRGLAVIMLTMSYQLTGNLPEAFGTIYAELKKKEARQNTYHTRLLITFCFLNWVEGDLGNMQQTSLELLKLGQELHLSESTHLGQYFSGLSQYFRNELGAAEKSLTGAVRSRDKVNIFNFAHASFVLSLTRQVQGKATEATEIAQTVVNYGLATGNAPLLQLGYAFQAELALRQGKIAEAFQWTKNYQAEPFATAHRFYVPQLTLARILLAQDTTKSRHQAADLLTRMEVFYQSINNHFCLINIYALQAVLCHVMGDTQTSDEQLIKTLTSAETGGFIRLFLDLGDEMKELLNRRLKKDPQSRYVRKLLQNFEEEISDSGASEESAPVAIPTPLTSRELEVLELLRHHLSNQDIADRLFISRETVKRHTANMYRKLQVNNRLQAVDRASAQGILA